MSDFDKKLEAYLSLPLADRSISEGAELLLQLNRNRILYSNILNRPERHKDKLFYELDKYAKARAIIQDTKQFVSLNKQAEAIDLDTEAKRVAKGKREDHDDLPPEVQAYYVDNAEQLAKIRKFHTNLKKTKRQCDRADILSVLLEAFDAYKQNWELYDSYKQGDKLPEAELPPVDEKRLVNNRSYISKNKAKLAELKGNEELEKEYEKWLSKIQERVDELLAAGEIMTDEYQTELQELGVVFE